MTMQGQSTVVTYVIEYPGTNLIKIGQAKYFVDRFAQLKTGSPVDPVVLCVFRGSKHEREFHKKFNHLRHHGELYHFTAEVKAYIFSDEIAEHRMTRSAGASTTRLHDARHTAATTMLVSGTAPRTVAGILGHSSAVTTLSVYAHLLAGPMVAAADHLGAAMELASTVRRQA